MNIARAYKLFMASLVLAFLTVVAGVLVFSLFYDVNVVGDFFVKVFIPCLVALTLAWYPIVRSRLKD